MEQCDTIAALATPRGISALAIVRLSGADAHEVFKKCVSNPDNVLNSPPNAIRRYQYVDKTASNTPVDDITAITYCGPKSYTGENMVEIFCHGGYLVVNRIVEVLLKNGARYASAGEFTRRAFLNGKMDLLAAESVEQIIISKTEEQKNIAMNCYLGNTRDVLGKIRDELLDLLADIESGLEFPEDDDIVVRGKQEQGRERYKKNIQEIINSLKKELQNREVLKRHEKGLMVPIIGPANAGKSSVFNFLLREERAIVHETKGTTRDAISEELLIDGKIVTIVDTAGIEQTNDEIEKKGIDRSKKMVAEGALWIWVTGADRIITQDETAVINQKKPGLCIINKCDVGIPDVINRKQQLCLEVNIPYIIVSVKTLENTDEIIKLLSSAIHKNNQGEKIGTLFINARQEQCACKIVEHLKEAERVINSGEEVAVESIKKAVVCFEEFFGKITSDDVLERIFSSFCIGK